MREVLTTYSTLKVPTTHEEGVFKTTHIINCSEGTIYTKDRGGVLMPVMPTLITSGDLSPPISQLVFTRTWRVNGMNAAKEFYNTLNHDKDLDPIVVEAVRNQGIRRTASGYELTARAAMPLTALATVGVAYVDGLDLVVSKSLDALGHHPYGANGLAQPMVPGFNTGLVTSISIRTNQPNEIFWLACPNGAFPVHADYTPWATPSVSITVLGNPEFERVRVEHYSLPDALKGDVLKLYRSKLEADAFLKGDVNKLASMEAEITLRQQKLDAAEQDHRNAVARAEVEHHHKLQALELERKAMGNKAASEGLKVVPIFAGIIGLVAGFFSSLFG